MTHKQREIVRLLSLGLTGPEIAARLCLSEPGVRARLHRAYLATGARSQAGLVGWCIAHGVVSAEELRQAYAAGIATLPQEAVRRA